MKRQQQHRGKTLKVKRQGGGGGGRRVGSESLYDVSQPLGERGLHRAVNQAVRSQTRPAFRAYARQLGELEKSEGRNLGKASLLGQQATRNIGSYYKDLAAQEAQTLAEQQAAGGRLTGEVAGNAKQALAAIQAAGNASQEGIGAYQGQDIAARDRLQQMIAEQGAYAAREGAAEGNRATGQVGAREALLRGMAGSANIHGGEQVGEANRAIRNQMNQIREQYGENLGKITNAKKELIESLPELKEKALFGLRKEDQNYYLSQGALGVKRFEAGTKRKELKKGINYATVAARENLKLAKLKARERMEYLEQSGATYGELAAEKAKLSEGIIRLQKQLYKNKGGGGSSGAEGYQPFGKTYSYLRSATNNPKKLAEELYSHQGKRKYAYDKLRRYGATDKVARNAIKKLINQYHHYGMLGAAQAGLKAYRNQH